MQELMTRHELHVQKLEQVMRALENDQVCLVRHALACMHSCCLIMITKIPRPTGKNGPAQQLT